MKIVVASDIHGNILRSERLNVDRVNISSLSKRDKRVAQTPHLTNKSPRADMATETKLVTNASSNLGSHYSHPDHSHMLNRH